LTAPKIESILIPKAGISDFGNYIVRKYFYSAILILSWSYSQASPPIFGGFATGPDSGQYLFWFHPDLYAYEQGIPETGGELNLAPGEVAGVYIVAQRADFPFMTYLTDFSVRIYPDDLFPGLPGDQFSSFNYAVFRHGNDSLPLMPPLRSGQNSLCGGIPCAEQWATNPISLLNIAGEDLWLGFQWAETTPSAPQIRCRILSGAGAFNRFGSMTGNIYSWNILEYAPQFRMRYSGVMPSELSSRYGQRRPTVTSMPPDNFLINCFASDSARAQYFCGADTLIFRLPGKYDSISITSIYDDSPDSSSLVVAFDEEKILPVAASIDFPGRAVARNAFDLLLTNDRVDPIDLILGCDTTTIRGSGRKVTIDGFQTVAVSFAITVPDGDSVSSFITIQDDEGKYYPLLTPVVYPLDQQTPVEDAEPMPVRPQHGFDIFPNPSLGKIQFRIYDRAGGARLEIFNIAGQKVTEVTTAAGITAVWDGRDRQERPLPSGIYFVRMKDSDATTCRKIVLLR
jgi:hypothetical protein